MLVETGKPGFLSSTGVKSLTSHVWIMLQRGMNSKTHYSSNFLHLTFKPTSVRPRRETRELI